jgi:hexosaminidase
MHFFVVECIDSSKIAVNDKNSFQSEEAYKLEIVPGHISLTASAVPGIFYGLQTLRQLSNTDNTLPCLSITDSPRFKYRGVMIDVSRHFFKKDFILKQIDVMARLKLNRLHLHLTDAAGWRIAIKSYPLLTKVGAWRNRALWKQWWFEGGRRYAPEGSDSAFGGYYTKDDIRQIVQYAAKRHITIIPEVELPAHSEEALAAYPNLACIRDSTKKYVYAPSDFCPGNEEVFTFWTKVLKEITELFPSKVIHIGGDEASRTDWKTCPRCQALMKKAHIKDVDGLQSYFIRRIQKIAASMGRDIIGWDEILAGGAPDNSTIMIWRGENIMNEALAQQHPIILSPGKYCYLDAYQDAPQTQPDAIGGYLPLEKIYNYRPVPDTLSKVQQGLIQGVQANLWTEYVPTPEHCEEMLYPRTFAIAEVGWSPENEKNYEDFHRRAIALVDTLRLKGYHPFDLAHEYGTRIEARTPLHTLSVNKQVIYNRPYNNAYPANGAVTLTDGLRGGWTYGDGRWQGFIGPKCLDVTIDLGRDDSIHTVYADFLQAAGAEVWLPATYKISISKDNTNFVSLTDTTYPTDILRPFVIQRYQWNGKSYGRYIRFQADCCSAGGWLFTDEIIVD